MNLEPFALERYFAEHEFSARHLLSSSDPGGWKMSQVLEWADEECLRLWEGLRLGYTESHGLPLLREEIAGLYLGVSPDQVLVAAPEEAIFLAMQSLLQTGDHVICTWPGYQSLYSIAEGIGCHVTKWEPDEGQGWRFDPRFLAEAITDQTRLIVINFPHNPTGSLPSREDFDEIIEIAKTKNVAIFSDEMYRYLEFEAAKRLPSACEIYDQAISLFGMSKSLGLPGLRIGWLATRDRAVLDCIATLKDYTTICSSAPSEVLALIGLRAKGQILSTLHTRLKQNLALADAFLSRHGDRFSWVRPRAGTIGFVRLAQDSADKLSQQAVSHAGIMLVPSSTFQFGDQHFRLGFGRDDFEEALNSFDAFLSGK